MRFRIECIVDGMAIGSAQTLIVLDHRLSAAISENKIIFRNHPAEWISRIRFNARQRGWSIHIPECNAGISGAAFQDSLFQKLIKYAHATMLDDQITRGCL